MFSYLHSHVILFASLKSPHILSNQCTPVYC